MIEPEKEIVLTIADSRIGFVVSLDKVFGICHPFYEMKCSEE
jgi:hypothetical protein